MMCPLKKLKKGSWPSVSSSELSLWLHTPIYGNSTMAIEDRVPATVPTHEKTKCPSVKIFGDDLISNRTVIFCL